MIAAIACGRMIVVPKGALSLWLKAEVGIALSQRHVRAPCGTLRAGPLIQIKAAAVVARSNSRAPRR